MLIVLFLLIACVSVLVYYYCCIASVELDDVHPLIKMKPSTYDQAQWLWVIPLYNNDPISNYPEWIQKLKTSGKKIGMHGVKHTLAEFDKKLSNEYIEEGIKEFEKAFGYTPTHFKAPKLMLHEYNQKYIEKRGIKIRNRFDQIVNRVLHTEDDRDKHQGKLTYEI